MKLSIASILAFASIKSAPTSYHKLELVKRAGQSVPFYYPESITENFVVGQSLVAQTPAEAFEFGKSQLLAKLVLSASDIVINHSHIDSSDTTHIYALHMIGGVVVDNHHASIHIKNGQVLSFSSSIPRNPNNPIVFAEPRTSFSLAQAEAGAVIEHGAPRDVFPAKQVYVEIPGGKLVYVYQFQLRDDSKAIWIQVSIDGSTGQTVQVVDYVQQASYKVIEFPRLNPLQGFTIATDPSDKTASPSGWNNDGQSHLDTQGNNIDSHVGTLRASGGSTMDFNTAWDAKKAPTTAANKNAAIVNNFYVTNMMHDISYQYGFTEAAGNFQTNNFDRGGISNDRVVVNNQASGSNNANFATPPDGQKPTMNMYLWTFSTPQRDGSLENSIPMHEYTHGISTRLTGGAGNVNCLSTTEAGDTLAIYLERKSTDTRSMNVVIGEYVYNNPLGIRSKPYSTSMSVNPYTLSYVATQNEVHAIGELWANTLFELYWNMVDAFGFSSNWLDATQQKGNIMALQLVIGGLKLQPCSPKFLTARDAIIAADVSYYGGNNRCLIWRAFAKRGMGTDAVNTGYKDGFAVPSGC